VPLLKRLLSFLSINIDLGGIYHKNQNSFTIELIGLFNLILILIIFSIDIKILSPVLNNEVMKIGTDWR
jgi:hypothetical protein